MTAGILFGLAWHEDLPPVVGAAPYPVLARQLPRLLVQCLNEGEDRGIRFFPFVGNEDGVRRYLVLRDVLAPETLLQLHGQERPPALLVDGVLGAEGWRLRILDGATGRERFDEVLELDPGDPRPALQRALFEITGVLGRTGRPPRLPDLEGAALSWFLVAKDDLLGLEADILRDDRESMLRGIREGMALAPDQPPMRDLLLELATRMVRRGLAVAAVADAVAEGEAAAVGAPATFHHTCGNLLEACGQPARARAPYARAVAAGHRPAMAKLAALSYQAGEAGRAVALCREALASGGRDPLLVAQLAAAEEAAGRPEERDRLCEELLELGHVPAEVARMLVSWLCTARRYAEAVACGGRMVDDHPGHAGIALEHGRALLLDGAAEKACAELERCLANDPDDAVRAEAHRLLGYARTPQVVDGMLELEEALGSDDRKRALATAKAMVRRSGDHAESWLLLGVVRQRLRQPRRAERALRRALQISPHLGEAHNRLGILLVARGATDEGYHHLQLAVAELPEDPAPRLHLAQACSLLGRRDEGLDQLARATRLGARAEMVEEVRAQFFGDSA